MIACEDAVSLHARSIVHVVALEPAHALARVRDLAKELGKDGVILMNMCGRGDKDVFSVAEALGVEL